MRRAQCLIGACDAGLGQRKRWCGVGGDGMRDSEVYGYLRMSKLYSIARNGTSTMIPNYWRMYCGLK